jgi:lipoprotein-anchoring transpeptidase ErfK/SrfK
VFAAVAFADSRAAGKLADGTRVAGVSVGGLTEEQAIVRLRARLGEPALRRGSIHVDGRAFTLDARKAGVRLDLRSAVRRAHDAGRDGSIVERGWRELTGGRVEHDERAPIAVDRAAVRSFVGSVHAAVARKPVDAQLKMELTSVTATEARPGRRLAGRDKLVERLTASFENPRLQRSLDASVVDVPPARTAEDLWKATPTVVTVSREGKTVRVFDRGKVVKSYHVAIGEPKYPTPTGRFVVQTMQKNPTWNVPDSEWAGKLRGQTIPGDDPRNPLVARWIGFNGSVGFHGTKSISSLGRAASHGCVRMRPADVIDLYERVQGGTPVLVA